MNPFPRTLRAMEAERWTWSGVSIGAGVLVLAAWAAWMVRGDVGVFVVGAEARIEVERAALPVQAPLSGRLKSVDVQLGQQVHTGDPLLEFDVEPQRLDLDKARARLDGLRPEIEATKKQLQAQQQAGTVGLQGGAASVAEAQARYREAAAAAKLAAEDWQRARMLAKEGLTTEAEVGRARSEVEQRQAATEAMRLAVGRIAAGSRVDASNRLVEAGSMERQLAQLDGEVRVTEAEAARLEHEIERRTVRAGGDGEVAELSALAAGSVVKEGDRLLTVLPRGRLRAVAELPAGDALGVVHVGQIGRLRLAGLPWAQHGTVGATVTRVASEIRDGHLRVELELADGSRLPLQHGLPGTVEVEVERTSPALLLLRAAGKMLDKPAPVVAPAPATSGATPP